MERAGRINLDKPRYDQSTYMGRFKHFVNVTNPLNLFATGRQLDEAKKLVELYRHGQEPPGVTANEIWKAKHLYDSAFHPVTKEKMFMPGRMSAQVPMNMFVTGCMITFYRTTPAIVFWQWANQSVNAVVNHTNNAGLSDGGDSNKRLMTSYAIATTAATGTGLALKQIAWRLPPVIARLIPFVAVASANCINIPFMRSNEIVSGIHVKTEDGTEVGQSKRAARKGIAQVVFSRISMALPIMVVPSLIMHKVERGHFLKRYPWVNAPMQVGLVGIMLVIVVPICCAIFPQQSSLAVSKLEDDLQQKLKSLGKTDTRVYFNKGL